MKLNTDDIVADTREELSATGLTFHRIMSPWRGDYTCDRSLYAHEVDRNFYNLKAQDIKEVYMSGTTLVLVRWNDEKIPVNIDALNELAEAQKEANEQTELLSAATKEAITKIIEELEILSGDVATQEWVLDQNYLKEEKAKELYVLKDAIDTIILDWAEANLKTINCHSLIGCGNIPIECGGGGSGSSVAITAGSAITISTFEGESKVSVKVSEAPLETIEKDFYSGKNFLRYDKSQNALKVNGVDADSIYVTQDIQVGGTPFADMARSAGIFDNNVIPSGMTLQEILTRMFCSEYWGTPDVDYYFTATTDNPTIFISGDTETIIPGQEMFFAGELGVSRAWQKAIATGFTAGGYELNGEIYKNTAYTLDMVAQAVLSPSFICKFSGFTEYDEETGKYVPAKDTNGELKKVYASAGRNTFGVYWSGVTFLPGIMENDVILHDVSSKGNISSAATIISNTGFSGYTKIMITGETIYHFDSPLQNYFAFHTELSDYSDTPEANGEFISRLRPYEKPIQVDELTPADGERGVDGARQITVAVPSYIANSIKLYKKGLDGEYAEINTPNLVHSTAIIEGAEYTVLGYIPLKTFSTEYYKIMITKITE